MQKSYKRNKYRKPYKAPEARDERESLTNQALSVSRKRLNEIPNIKSVNVSVLESVTLQQPIGRRLKKRQKSRFNNKQTSRNEYLITLLASTSGDIKHSELVKAAFDVQNQFKRKDIRFNLSLSR